MQVNSLPKKRGPGRPRGSKNKQHERTPNNTRWVNSNRTISLAMQLGTEFTSNLYRQGYLLRQKSNPDDAKRIEAEIIFVKAIAERFQLAQWKILDLLLTLGIREFVKDYWPKVMIMDTIAKKRAATIGEYFDILNDNIEGYADNLEKTADDLVLDLQIDFVEKQKKEIMKDHKNE